MGIGDEHIEEDVRQRSSSKEEFQYSLKLNVEVTSIVNKIRII